MRRQDFVFGLVIGISLMAIVFVFVTREKPTPYKDALQTLAEKQRFETQRLAERQKAFADRMDATDDRVNLIVERLREQTPR